ncbi:hypothetical protein FBUS_07309 [Fasciolopsis buskii]|uniref:KICSTOR complex protein SZT2 n=1 Tax=Fasciolopsis buskii TaxID=27845 RepID=A0A8E0S3N8_9TREM|nr:hypothetical protein FBUS_07309 [Fasciolopsis buski]
MNSCDIIVEKLYATPCHTITVEQLSFWYISHLKQRFVYSPEHRAFHFVCPASERQNEAVDYFLHSMVEIVSVLPFCRKQRQQPQQQTTLNFMFDSDTKIFCLRPEQKYVIIVDFSSSIFHASNDGDCYLNDALHILESVVRQLAGAPRAFIPGANYSLRQLKISLSIIAVLPNQRCYTLLSGWLVNTCELPVKIRHISRLLMKIERDLLQHSSQATKSRECSTNSLTDILKHGILAASSLAPNNEFCSMLIITDGCLSVSNVEILDRSLTHLRSEGIRCSFVLLNNPSLLSTSESEGSALCFIKRMNVCLPQADLCSLVAHSTSGFCVNTSDSTLSITDSYGSWHEFLELLITTRLVCRHDALDGNLDWVPAGTLETQRRLVRASLPVILVARLRDGYKLRYVQLLRCGNRGNTESNGPLSKPNAESQANGTDRSSIQRLTNFVELELTMLWKVGITFTIHIRGLWPDIHRINELMKNFFVLHDGVPDSNVPPQVKTHMIEGYPANNLHVCYVSFSISANYSFLHEVTCKRKYPVQNVNRASTISRFVMYHRHLSVTDQQIEHVFKFWYFKTLSKTSGQLPSGSPSVFTVIPDTSGKLIVVPSLLAHRLNGDPDRTLTIGENKSQFFHFWRLFIERDLLECYRWLEIRNIFGILEHDSPLSTNLHLPPEGDRYTASVACRQSLDRLHAFLSHWCTFTLLENSVYVRILSLGDDEAVHFSSCLADVPVALESQSSTISSDIKFSNQLPPTLSERLSFFCVVRVELKIPEFCLRVGFVLGTLPQIQNEVMSQLKEQISALRFLPRGRQAIPKSRHKSGAPLPTSEWNSVPPLQRSWEDIPCCTIFQNRLDRLVVNTGIWSKRLFIGYRSPTPRDSLSGINHSDGVEGLVDQQFKDFCSLGGFQRPGLDLSLLAQHLHHESKIWVIQPTTFSDEALRLLFCSLLNLRFQEGFHLVRVGPQTGFVSLATEISLCPSNKETEVKCLVQYQLYPLGDARLSDTDVTGDSSFSVMDIGLKEAITRVIMDQKNKCSSKGSTTVSIFDVPYDASERLTHPFKLVQLVTELWIQPIEGRITSCQREIHHWNGSTIAELAEHIFEVDRRCVVAYATLERLGTVVNSCISFPSPTIALNAAADESIAHVKLESVLGSLAPEASVEWAQTSLSSLAALSPQLILLYSLLESCSFEEFDPRSGSNSDPNNFLLSQFCDFLTGTGEAREIYLSPKDSEEYTMHLLANKDMNGSKQFSGDLYPQWRCFILPGSTVSDTICGCIPADDFTCNPLLTIVFVPKSFRDASNYIVRRFVADIGAVTYPPDASFFPAFVYACSRAYLSFLIDDRWTYQVPPTLFFDLRYNMSQESRSACASHPVLSGPMLDPPDNFVAVGRQNLRLTWELNSLWISLNNTIRYVSRLHLDSFIFSVYHCLNKRITIADKDVEFVLQKAESYASSAVFSVNLSPLLLLTCEQFSSGLQEWLQQSSDDYSPSSDDRLSVVLSNRESNSSFSGPTLHLPINPKDRVLRPACSCWHSKTTKYRHIVNHYLLRLENHNGLFILSKAPFSSQNNSTEKCPNEDELDTSNKIFQSANMNSELTHSEDSTDNESENATKIENDCQKMEANKKRNMVDTPEDRLFNMVSQWFVRSAGLNEIEGPVFIKLIGLVSYNAQSFSVQLNDGLPLFCFNHIRNALVELITMNADTSTLDKLSVDLFALKFDIHLSVWHWPRHFCSQIAYQPDKNVTIAYAHSPNRMDSSPPDSSPMPDTTKQYNSPLALEDALETLSSWFRQPGLSELTNSQKSTISQFVCRLLWQFQEDIVCSLRAIKPILVHSIEFVLRHIEDTSRLCRTPLFEQCGLLCTEDYSTISDGKQMKFLSGKSVLDSAPHRKFTYDIAKKYPKRFVDPRKLIKIDRIPLEFVVFSSETFTYFVRQFEKIFISSDASLEYLDGYYYLRPSNMHTKMSAADTGHSRIISNSPRPELRASLHTKSDTACGSLLETILRRRSFDQGCFTTRLARRSRAANYPNGGLWSSVKTHSRKLSFFTSIVRENHDHLDNNQMPSSLGYEGDTSDLGEVHEELTPGSCPARIPCQLRTKRANGIRANSEGSQASLRFTRPRGSCQQEVLPYWLIFRLCVNSVSLFYHHSDSLLESGCVGPLEETNIDPSHDSRMTFTSSNSNPFYFACKSIHAVIKLVNQRILLNKLRNEGICDELLMPKLSDPLKDQASSRKGIRPIMGDKHFKSPVERSRTLQSPGRRNRRAQQFRPIASSSGDSSGEETAPAYEMRINRERKTRTSLSLSVTNRISPHTGCSSSTAWFPGSFACPIQMVSYLRLHPRILAATAHVSQKDKGRQIVSALRCLLEKPAITNRPDMFFLIDQATRGSSSEPLNNQPSSADKVSSLDEFPVFYMILKGGTSQSFKSDPVGSLVHDKTRLSAPTTAESASAELESMDEPQLSGVDDSKSTLGTTKATQSSSPVHPSSCLHKTSDLVLQITLHGIDTPSLRLCNFVRQMLQQFLDDLILQHFSDGLSRNAINRLSVDDLSFLSNRQPLVPQQKCLIALPRFLLNPLELFSNSTYRSHQLVLAFCHYFRQNLSLFLTAVKLDSSAHSLVGDELMELFLYNRPRAQGVAKPGVATLLFQLIIANVSPDGSLETEPYRIVDWTLPCQQIPIAGTCRTVTLEQLQRAVSDVCDYTDSDHKFLTSSASETRLIISVRLWQRGDADIKRLKNRVQTAITHSLYDLITEFFVLTSPVKLYEPIDTPAVNTNIAPGDSYKSKTSVQMNPHLTSVVWPWLAEGKLIDSPLVLKIEVPLFSGILMDQFLVDFLNPFNSSLKQPVSIFDGDGSVTTRFSQNMTSSPIGTANPTTLFGSDTSLSEIFFHVFFKKNRPTDGYWLKQQQQQQQQQQYRNKIPYGSASMRPGVKHEYLVVGKNILAWRWFVQRVSQSPGCGVGTRELPDRFRSDRYTPMDSDVLLRLQSLQVTVQVPVRCASIRNTDVPSAVPDQLTNRSHTDESALISTRLQTPALISSTTATTNITNLGGWHLTPGGLATELSSSGLPATSRFPEFCPVQLSCSGIAQSTEFNISPRASTAITVQQQSSPTQPSFPGHQGPPTFSNDLRDTAQSSATDELLVPMIVRVPRQGLCFIKFTSRLITVYIYNWSKEETDRLSGRLTSLAD